MQEKAMLNTPNRMIFLSFEKSTTYGDTVVPGFGRLLDFLNALRVAPVPHGLLQSVVLPFSALVHAFFRPRVSSMLFSRLFICSHSVSVRQSVVFAKGAHSR